MADVPVDARWPKVLSLAVHELRTPMTVVAGYIRMLLKDRAGPLTDPQRRLLEEAEKSCARLTALLTEVSDLSNLESGTAPLNRQTTDLHKALRDVVDQLPPLPDREVPVDLQLDGHAAPIEADPVRLTQAFSSVIKALRRELIGDAPLVVRQKRTSPGYEIQIGDADTLAALDAEQPGRGEPFDEWRGGSGLVLPVARRIIEAHGGRIWGAPGGRKAGARIVL
ncbi:MAG TPA: HAMP domain-containing sensor histidine kinase [Vicinamibacterales bacterium]